MKKYDLSTPAAIRNAAELSRTVAGREPNQSGYNAAWLHGYARALQEVADQLEPTRRARETALHIVELFENLLELHGITIPDPDRPEGNDAPLYGATYGDLIDAVTAAI